MKDASAEEILNEIEEMQTFHRNCRAFFPHLSEAAIGLNKLPPVPYYAMHGMEVSFDLSRELTKDDIEKNNAVADWMNQNVIVRLCALIERYKIAKDQNKINDKLEGYNEVRFVWKLRNIFAHKAGRHKPTGERDKNLVRQLNTYFNLGINVDDPSDFPLDILRVIDPLFEGCKNYVRGKLGVT
jgi:hypothetical protein